MFEAVTTKWFFRISYAHEHSHYVSDIASDDVYILDPDLHVSFLQHNSDQDEQSTPETSPTTPYLTTPSMVELSDYDGTPEVRVTFNLPITPPVSSGLVRQAGRERLRGRYPG